MGSNPASKTSVGSGGSPNSVPFVNVENEEPEIDWEVTPEFIYGGPFIQPPTKPPFLDGGTPINTPLQGTYKMSYAYQSLKDRMPVILTRVIDYCARDPVRINTSCGASEADLKLYVQYVTKLKNDLVTNKNYDLLTVDTPDARKWNQWIDGQQSKTYFTNTWLFTECYVYRRLREGCELYPSLSKFDPFLVQKESAFADNVEAMCIVADKLVTMLPKSEKDKRKADFITLLKLSLWSNKCDLSLSAGAPVHLSGKEEEGKDAPPYDPFQMIIDFKDKLIIDDTAKIADAVVNKAETMAKNIAAPPSSEGDTEPPPPEPEEGDEGKPKEPEGEPKEPPKIPCPAKITVPSAVIFDIICDNCGYELFTDLCLAHFLVSQKIVQKVRFHVKQMPWFVSDVTLKDFARVIDMCAGADYSRTVAGEPKPAVEGQEETEPGESRVITSENLCSLGQQWLQFLLDGTFELMAEDYWTWPHPYKDMKRIDYNLYRKLQLGCALLFKGDLNYRKLLAERNCNPYLGFEAALQGFIPAPVIAVRTVKAELICGMPKGKYELLNKLDPKWMQKGDYGLIQFCAKGEALKPSDKPCVDYGVKCFGETCPVHTDM